MERALEHLVWQRAGGRFEYCQICSDNLDLPFEVDHIIAEHHLGLTDAKNCCLACYACNRHKGPNVAGVDPKTKSIVPLFHPRRQKWSRHFRWDG
ncbi:MAG TPA: HNH endonuclease, partial [Isosphaeraceae bacterium]|nr:HNH endonuclease [Isosphaeraceae bacterium]